MTWQDFRSAAAELALLGEERFERISSVEPLIVDGRLYLGMIWKSRKALDLLRDPRCTVHSAVANREDTAGDFKVYGRAVEVRDLAERGRYCDALYGKIGWKPDEPEFHLFAVNIESVAFNRVQEDEMISRLWTPGGGDQVVRRWKPNA